MFEENCRLGSHSKRSGYMALLMEIENKTSMGICTSDPKKQNLKELKH